MSEQGNEGSSSAPAKGERFTTTHWSLILRARDLDSPQAIEALEKLCQAYWYPLYAYLRREGKEEETAKDLTQAFFERFLERNYLEQVDRQKGKFRSFLLGSLKHFLADEWDKARAQKRGGGKALVSLDDDAAEERYRLEPIDEMSPDQIFARRWALTVLEQAVARLEAEYRASGKGELFEQLRNFLAGDAEQITYAAAAARLEMAENTLKTQIRRLRLRNRELLREVVAETVASPEQISAEVQELFEVLSKG
jgi:DNA-directed RNA polymerase specialized sigma24 family protein